MADRKVHYEAAFEALLRHHGIPCVAVDEAKRAVFANAKLKSFDFVVYSKSGVNLLADIKGRQMRGKSGAGSFQTWATRQDVDDLLQWEQVFGDGFRAVLVFVYWIDPPLVPGKGNVPARRPLVLDVCGRIAGIPAIHAAALGKVGNRRSSNC